MKRFLLVNPWIYDFAAYDYGLKPVGLLRIGQELRQKGAEIYLIDCLAGCARSIDEYGFSKIRKERIEKPEPIKQIERLYFRYGIPVPEFMEKLKEIKNPEAILVTSGMTYWYPGIELTIKLLKTYFKKVPVILGGIYPTLCYKHALLNSQADIVWKGDYLPKKYFSQKGFYPAYDLLLDKKILPIQLTRGCPFRCSYCASRKLNPKFEMKDPVNLFEEVMYYQREFGTHSFVFYDDALTCNSSQGLKKFLRLIIASGKKLTPLEVSVKDEAARPFMEKAGLSLTGFTFHTPNGLHARFIDEELAELLKKANFKDLRLSLETSDSNLQEWTGGKVTNDDLKRAIRNLKEAGFNKSDLGVYLLVGANWLALERTKEDIMFINSLGAKAILASYSPIPGTKDYQALVKKGIIKKDLEPLWHNKTIFPELLAPFNIQKIRELRRFTSKLNLCHTAKIDSTA